jgi:DNA-binding LytR/AlgR family response regulator
MNPYIQKITSQFKEESGLYSKICFGVFLFVIFFQPFQTTQFDINNMLLFNLGIGAIVFFFMVIVRILLNWLVEDYMQTNHNAVLPYLSGGLMVLILSAVAIVFYLRYVGSVEITFYVVFKVLIICTATITILFVSDSQAEKTKHIISLLNDNKTLAKQVNELEENYLSKTIEFLSENKNDNISLTISDVVFIKSADNYVELIYKEGIEFKKSLIRNTLKNIEIKIKPYSNFIRCHRTCIINTYYIKNLERNFGAYYISIDGYQEQIPVSRQYILKIKESI